MADEDPSLESLPILDNNRLTELSDGDMDFLIDLMGDYMGGLAELYDQLKAYAFLHDGENIRKISHSIAGSSANIGAARLSQAARQIETDVRHSDVESAVTRVRQIEDIVFDTREAISNYTNNSRF